MEILNLKWVLLGMKILKNNLRLIRKVIKIDVVKSTAKRNIAFQMEIRISLFMSNSNEMYDYGNTTLISDRTR